VAASAVIILARVISLPRFYDASVILVMFLLAWGSALGIAGFYMQQISLSVGRLATSVVTTSVVNPVVSVFLGALVLQERLDKTPPWHAVVAIGALAVALLGAVIIASASEKESQTEEPVRQPSLA